MYEIPAGPVGSVSVGTLGAPATQLAWVTVGVPGVRGVTAALQVGAAAKLTG